MLVVLSAEDTRCVPFDRHICRWEFILRKHWRVLLRAEGSVVQNPGSGADLEEVFHSSELQGHLLEA